MFKKLLLTTLSIAAFSAAASVNAATYNFVDLIDGGAGATGTFSGVLGDGTVVASAAVPAGGIGENGYQNFTWTVDGLALTATAFLTGPSGTTPYPYLDYNDAGLGVCKFLDSSNQCDPSNDDNVTLTERLVISFADTVSIDVAAMIFRDGNHNPLTPNSGLDQVWVWVDAGGAQRISDISSSILSGTSFTFGVSPTDKQQFYISSLTAVPIPAAAWLFGSALIGLAGVARKRKMS